MSFDKFWESVGYPHEWTDIKMTAQAAYEKGYRDGKSAAIKETTEKLLEIMSDRNA